jgi:hypothetical protein
VGITGEYAVVTAVAEDDISLYRWSEPEVTRLPNPYEPVGGRYRAVDVDDSGDVLGWVTADASSTERRYGIWRSGELNALTPGWECYALREFRVACTDGLRLHPFYAGFDITLPDEPFGVTDFAAVASTGSTITLSWTQVDDGTGAPAWYRVKYSEPPISWARGTIGCDRSLEGDEIGAEITCTVEGLDPETAYDFQLMSYRYVDGVWQGALYSNVATGRTGSLPVQDLAVTPATASALTVAWTQVGDGLGGPAWYRVKYGAPLTSWREAAIGCGDRTIEGNVVGAPMSCTIDGLSPGVTYDVQLMSYRVEEGAWANAMFSNLASGMTMSP